MEHHSHTTRGQWTYQHLQYSAFDSTLLFTDPGHAQTTFDQASSSNQYAVVTVGLRTHGRRPLPGYQPANGTGYHLNSSLSDCLFVILQWSRPTPQGLYWYVSQLPAGWSFGYQVLAAPRKVRPGKPPRSAGATEEGGKRWVNRGNFFYPVPRKRPSTGLVLHVLARYTGEIGDSADACLLLRYLIR